ncbi:MAG: hypothetical protein PF441_01475 [Desulfuromusa sp.]|nr:hypothetical protein [Desulfuromusa sp.]
MEKFPKIKSIGADSNPAISLFGRRYHKDQTPVEYLAEFLLAFSSPKCSDEDSFFSFQGIADDTADPTYKPEDKISLKLFSFFASSKFDTRHPVHVQSYKEGLNSIRNKISSTEEKKDFDVHLIQSLLEGFVGVAKNRTWATQAFLPFSSSLLAREVDWRHSKAIKRTGKEWCEFLNCFDVSAHNFMARGGELLFLQLVNLFGSLDSPAVESIRASKDYLHLKIDLTLRRDIEAGLKKMLTEVDDSFGRLVDFVEHCLENFSLADKGPAKLGWIPKQTLPEALLFASEILNICNSSHGALQKAELLQSLCCMHVLRSLCSQARRLGETGETEGQVKGFVGNYAWVVCSPDSEIAGEARKLAQESNHCIEQMLYRVLRNPSAYPDGVLPANEDDLSKADDNVFKLFRKLGKEIGLIIPLTGKNQRLVLPPQLIRFLVYSLINPGGRIRLSEFYRRIFAHYGIAIASREQAIALKWIRRTRGELAVSRDASWFEDELQRGGVLIELSDAVSMVENPYK